MNNTNSLGIWIAAVLFALIMGLPIAFGNTWGAVIIIALVGIAAFAFIASKMRTSVDADWLVRWVVIGFIAKIAGTLARYGMVLLYGGGDSYRYYRVGTDLAIQFRSGQIPDLTGRGGFGTQVLELFTGGLFAIYTPDLLGGFMIFSIFAFVGQLMLYAAFRRWAGPRQLKPYALLLLYLPTYAFWPSSIGKDALVLFALGGAAYFISRVLDGFEIRWLLALAPFLALLGLVRIHIAGLIVGALIGAGLIVKTRPAPGTAAGLRRLIVLGGFMLAGVLVVTIFPDIFGVDLTSDDAVDSFTSDVVRRTSEKGTVASGGPVSSPTDIPEAIALVLFRPFIFEASELQHFFAALETSILLGLTIWKLPTVLRNWRSWRSNAYIVFSTFYVLGFSIAFSVVRNLGIIARQRGQVLALFLVIVIGMGWERNQAEETVLSDAASSTGDRRGWPNQHPTAVP